jgi:hypothetical protein
MAAMSSDSLSDDSELLLYDDLKENLCNCLDEIVAVGNFAAMGTFTNSINPNIRLKTEDGLGHAISLPLGSRDAFKLIQAAHHAPFGKGEQTIVDLSVRNTWEISPHSFTLDEKWQSYVDQVKVMACTKVGLQSVQARAELYKMLLYGKGAMFKPHADSEKAPGMFGTLVISLPSAHFGGCVVMTHKGQRRKLQTYKHEYLAWSVMLYSVYILQLTFQRYSDVIHEVY